MPIDHSRRFIFVHIPKTAGTSIMNALFGITVDKEEFIETSALSVEQQRNCFIGDDGQYRRLHHYPLAWIARSALPLRDYFAFAFVRNPFDRLVSEYHFLRMHRAMCFDDFVLNIARMVLERGKGESWFSLHFLPQLEFVSINGAIACDFLGRFESLTDDFGHVCRTLGINSSELRQYKKSVRGEYRSYYGSESRAFVETWYRCDLEHFGYEF